MMADDDLLLRLGANVREARKAIGLSRKALADASGVSPRYLAQLEGGTGNISISLLNKVAAALGRPVDWFVRPEPATLLGCDAVARLFRDADASTQTQIHQLLNPTAAKAHRANRICLIGLRGAGKSMLSALSAGLALAMTPSII